MTRFVGIDAHKKLLQYCILGPDGEKIAQGSCGGARFDIERFAENVLTPEDEVVLEATGNTWAIVDLLEPKVARVAVSNPMKTKAIASAKIKTDKIDAKILAELLRCRFLPEVWKPDADTRRMRSLTHRRASLVHDRTGVKNRLHSVLAQRLILVPFSKLFSIQGLQWLRELEIDEDGRAMIDSDLRLLTHIEQEIEAFDKRIAELSYPDENVRLMMTLPGVGVTVAQGLLAAWGDIERFPNADRAASYLGLVPSVRQSAGSCHHGRITKQGNSHARWMMIQAAQHVDKHPGPIGVFFRRLNQKKNRNVAVTATARKMATIAWHMLKNREPYRYAAPANTAQKLAALRILATGERRKRGPRKGTKPSPNYGTGVRTRKIPALAEVCESEGLPLPIDIEALHPGEIRMLREQGVLDHAHEAHTSRRVTRNRSKA